MSVKITQEMITSAQECEEKYGIPSSITLGQIILESSGTYKNGMSKLAYVYHNLFGITAGKSWTGQTVTMSNSSGKDTQTYRIYNSIYDSIIDHANVLTQSRYTRYTQNAQNVSEYANAIQKGGYATDPLYATKLTAVIAANNLTAYDTKNWIGKSYSNADDNTENGDTSGKKLTIIGDIVLLCMVTAVIILCVVFFIKAFQRGVG